MADFLPKFIPGRAVTFTASADVTGGRLVDVTGNRTVGPAGADVADAVGTAGYDAKAGEEVTVYIRGPIHSLVAAGAIAAAAKVITAAGGKVATIGAGTNAIGIALEAAAADNDVIDVMFL